MKRKKQTRLDGEVIEAGRDPALPGETPPPKKERTDRPAEHIDTWAYHNPLDGWIYDKKLGTHIKPDKPDAPNPGGNCPQCGRRLTHEPALGAWVCWRCQICTDPTKKPK